MIPLNEDAAINRSMELAKIICANPNLKLYPDTNTANQIADFIKTMQNRLTGESE